MTARIRGAIPSQRALELLWSNAPPSFLAPCLRPSSKLFSTTPFLAISPRKLQRRTLERRQDNRDAYTLRQVKARKDANLSRQAVLREQRKEEMGDPIRGVPTSFVESFDSQVPQEARKDTNPSSMSVEGVTENAEQLPSSPAHASKESDLDHGITHGELDEALKTSRRLTEPWLVGKGDPTKEREMRELWKARDQSASEAVARIVNLTNASNKHRTKKNIERIVDTFGRHNTDLTLKPKAAAVVKRDPSNSAPEATPRAGPDTGSSEVQIGILTAKIRVLADRYEGENRNDKINKRNLRLLLHRRQKLLKYMEKKERGSQRWQTMIETLGLTPATWHGEIAVQ